MTMIAMTISIAQESEDSIILIEDLTITILVMQMHSFTIHSMAMEQTSI